jgi:predicted alpha/beta-hydrolase family hydrolase
MTVDTLAARVGGQPVSFSIPEDPRWFYMFAHGAGADSRHPFMAQTAHALAERQIATMRWDMPYILEGRKRPDRADVAEEAVFTMWQALRAGDVAGDRAGELRALTKLPMFAGGKSFGGRMTSRAHAWRLGGLPGIRGIAFMGFPLYGAGQPPSTQRADHLARVNVPLLFVQGSRDELAELSVLRPVVTRLGATLHVIEGADHSFSGRDRSAEIATTIASWMRSMDPIAQ